MTKPKKVKRTRTAVVLIRLQPTERDKMKKVAALSGLGLSTWMRSLALAALNDQAG